ncbi:RNA-binding protein 26-like isoform X2 [Lytechinus pictus]|uniref:RNA-binding protein 26-like isoform X2 n=1 Tax=Lytechinus pictus TaxID=7653 RepID=UPI0030B9B7AD
MCMQFQLNYRRRVEAQLEKDTIMPVIENVEDLMTWLSKKLEPICDADPNALAKYVVALAKKDKSADELRATCIDQLGVFLVNETQSFVDDLFVALATKSYIPGGSANITAVEGGKQDPPLQPAAAAPGGGDLPTSAVVVETSTKEEVRSRSSNRDVTVENDERDHRRSSRRHSRSHSRSKSRSHSPKNRSRSRSYSPRRRRRDDDRRRRDDRLDRYGPRRYGDRDRDRDRERNRDRDFRDRDRDRERDRMRGRDGRDSGRYDDRGRNRDRDLDRDRDDRLKENSAKPSAISSVITVVSNDGPEPVQGSSKQGEQPVQRIRQRCRDYDEKGFCMKGEFCPYDHGNDPVVVEDIDMFRPPPNMDARPPVPSIPPAPQPPLPPLPPSQPPPPLLPPFNMPPPGFPPTTGIPLPPPPRGVPLLPPGRMHGPLRPNGPPPGPPPGLPPHMRIPPPPTGGPPLPPMPLQMNRPPPPLPPAPDATIPPPVPQPPSSPPRECSPPPPPSETKNYASSQDFQMEGYNPEDPSMEAQVDYFGGNRAPRQASSNLRTLVGIQTVPTTTREELEEIGALTNKDSSDEGQSERKVIDLTMGQKDDGVQEEQRRAVVKSDDSAMGYPLKRPFNQSTGGPGTGFGGAVDLRARIGGKGKGRFVPNNRILEVRKIPKDCNNITKLNEHFSKFGNIVNLQIAYAQDLEAALVTFSTHLEAKKAYQSTEAVFNNRFVKVFWHIPPENTTGENEPNQHTRKPAKHRIQLPTKKQLTVVRNHPAPSDKVVVQPSNSTLTKTIINTKAVAINQRLVTVQNNLANAKKAAAAHTSASVARKLAAAQEAVRKKQEEAKKLVAKKQMEIQKQKQELMNGFIQQQKILIAKLEQGKSTITTLKRAEIMKSIKMLSENIEKTKKELMDAKPKPKDKKQAERELLDTELDLYNQQSEGGDTSELRKRVDELRREAQALGLLDNAGGSRGRGNPRSVRGRGRGRGSAFVAARRRSSTTHKVVDKRPRGLVVGGFAPEDKDEVLVHFTSFGEIDNVEYNEDSRTYVLEFKTRQEAELAVAKGYQFKGDSLSLAWHKQQDPTSEMVEDTVDPGEELEDEEEEEMEDELEDDLLLVDDEEEEDDEEGRSWKR